MNLLIDYLVSVAYWFLKAIEWALFAYVIFSWLPVFPKVQSIMAYIMDPLLNPIRRMIDHSILKMRGIDLSPIVLYLLVAYGAQICISLR